MGGCSDRVIAAANDDVLVVVDDIETATPVSRATVHYVLARPQPLSDDAAPTGLVARMRYEAEFNCADMSRADRVHETTMVNGQTITNRVPVSNFKPASPDSLGATVIRSVCEPAFREDNKTGRPLRSIERDYLGRMSAD
jgi:hypothetical protein